MLSHVLCSREKHRHGREHIISIIYQTSEAYLLELWLGWRHLDLEDRMSDVRENITAKEAAKL
jgi:hypothetical protein